MLNEGKLSKFLTGAALAASMYACSPADGIKNDASDMGVQTVDSKNHKADNYRVKIINMSTIGSDKDFAKAVSIPEDSLYGHVVESQRKYIGKPGFDVVYYNKKESGFRLIPSINDIYMMSTIYPYRIGDEYENDGSDSVGFIFNNGSKVKSLHGRTFTEGFRELVMKYGEKYGVDPYNIAAHYFMESKPDEYVFNTGSRTNLYTPRLAYGNKTMSFLSTKKCRECFANNDYKELMKLLAAQVGVLQKDGSYSVESVIPRFNKAVIDQIERNNNTCFESEIELAAKYIKDYGDDWNPKQHMVRGVNNSYMEMFDDAVNQIRKTKIFEKK